MMEEIEKLAEDDRDPIFVACRFAPFGCTEVLTDDAIDRHEVQSHKIHLQLIDAKYKLIELETMVALERTNKSQTRERELRTSNDRIEKENKRMQTLLQNRTDSKQQSARRKSLSGSPALRSTPNTSVASPSPTINPATPSTPATTNSAMNSAAAIPFSLSTATAVPVMSSPPTDTKTAAPPSTASSTDKPIPRKSPLLFARWDPIIDPQRSEQLRKFSLDARHARLLPPKFAAERTMGLHQRTQLPPSSAASSIHRSSPYRSSIQPITDTATSLPAFDLSASFISQSLMTPFRPATPPPASLSFDIHSAAANNQSKSGSAVQRLTSDDRKSKVDTKTQEHRECDENERVRQQNDYTIQKLETELKRLERELTDLNGGDPHHRSSSPAMSSTFLLTAPNSQLKLVADLVHKTHQSAYDRPGSRDQRSTPIFPTGHSPTVRRSPVMLGGILRANGNMIIAAASSTTVAPSTEVLSPDSATFDKNDIDEDDFGSPPASSNDATSSSTVKPPPPLHSRFTHTSSQPKTTVDQPSPSTAEQFGKLNAARDASNTRGPHRHSDSGDSTADGKPMSPLAMLCPVHIARKVGDLTDRILSNESPAQQQPQQSTEPPSPPPPPAPFDRNK